MSLPRHGGRHALHRTRLAARQGETSRCWVLVLALALCAGCDRTPRFVPAGEDSTAVRPADSLAAYVQEARESWESSDRQDEAGSLTARLLLDDARLHPADPLARRMRTFLDSLALGAEVVGRGSLAVVNLFARSDPAGASWPYLFWREDEDVHQQGLEGGGMRLLDLLPSDGSGEAQSEDPLHLAVLFTRAAGGGQQPLVFVWRKLPGGPSWRLVQSLGPDSLGGVGSAAFNATPSSDGVVLESRTHLPTPRFDECATCPHIYRTRRFAWGPTGLASVSEEIETSPYYAFVRFVQALALNDREMAERFVADPSLIEAALGYDWGLSRGLWRLSPGNEGRSEHLVFFRGRQEAYRVHFARRSGDWAITGFEPTSRSIE